MEVIRERVSPSDRGYAIAMPRQAVQNALGQIECWGCASGIEFSTGKTGWPVPRARCALTEAFVAKIQVWVFKPSAKQVPKKYADRIAKYTQGWLIKRLDKDPNIAAAAPPQGKGKTAGFQIDGGVTVRVAGGNVNVAIKMQVSKDNSMFAFVTANGSTGAGRSDDSNAEGAEQVIDAILESKVKAIIMQIRAHK
jgi:hypothetical protein